MQVPEDIGSNPGKKTRAASEPPPEKPNRYGGSDGGLSCDAIRTDPQPETEERAFATSPWRIDWATLLHRVFDVDALACPNCDGRLRFLELVTDRFRTKAWLERLHLVAEPPATWPAGAPDDYVVIANDDIDSRACDWDP